MLFFDFEVFLEDWLVVILDMAAKKEYIIVNSKEELEKFYNEHVNDLWIGFNNRHYDDYILKAILCGLDPKELNDFIILKDKPGWMFSNLFREIPLMSYDVHDQIDKGLKFFEASMGHSIKESSVPFDINRKLTEQEIKETIEYCRHDVEETVEVFLRKKADFDAVVSMIKMFPEVLSFKDIGLTKAQLSAKILECDKVERNDEFDLSVLPCISIQKYKECLDFFTKEKHADYKKRLTLDIAGLEHDVGWGGIHAGKKKYINLGKAQGRQIWHIDVESFYPRLMIFHNLLTRNSKKPEKFKAIYNRRLELKHAGKKAAQAPLKIVINGTYGISKALTSTAYDPRNANLICLNGQLMLVDLIEHLEKIEDFELIQSNTDGLIISLPDTDKAFEKMDDVCYEWEKRNNMKLAFDGISAIWQKDVNNYIFIFDDGKIERKGSYVKQLSDLDYDLPIVNKAIVDRITKGIPIEKTIHDCNEMKEFQMIKKISSKYDHILHGGQWMTTQELNPSTGRMNQVKKMVGERKKLNEKCIRIYASTDSRDGGLWKVKKDGSVSKIDDTPEHAFIINDDVNDMKVVHKLDKTWYVNMAIKRLQGFGLER